VTTPDPSELNTINADSLVSTEDLTNPADLSMLPASGDDFLPKFSQEDFTNVAGGLKLPGIVDHPQAPAGASGMRKKIIDYAMTKLGQPYVWGALDCSGLVQMSYASVGVDLPRISYQQARYGRTVDLKAAKPGDLIAWGRERP
jgi:cell wall-associated NlpC family hydrolase